MATAPDVPSSLPVPPPPVPSDPLARLLGASRPVEVVDVGANPIDGDPPYLPLLRAGLARVTGFEPQAAALDRLLGMAGPHERYLPYALGDGQEHTLRVCATDGFSSLLEPDPAQLGLLVDFPRLAAVVDRLPVSTRRLDDVAEIERVDLLKIDVQGGELDVFAHGRSRLSDAVAVQTEVGFHRLYDGAPTFADVDLELRDLGLVPHRLVATKTWPLAPVQWADPLEADARHLVEADVLYVRDLARLDLLATDQLAALALVAHHCYRSYGVALRCVLELLARGQVAPDAEAAYRGLVAPGG